MTNNDKTDTVHAAPFMFVAPPPVRIPAPVSKTPTECAADLRRAIKAAVKAGTLPAAKYSVRTRYASMMSAIDVTVTDVPFCCYQITDESDSYHQRGILLTEVAQLLATWLDATARATGYRADGRHSFLDVAIDTAERDALFTFLESERRGEIARAAVA